MNNHRLEVVLSTEEIKKRIGELASEIAKEYQGETLVLVGILKGATTFLSDFARALHKAGHKDIEVEYMGISSYGSGTESNNDPRITLDLSRSIEGKRVLLVEDIIDTGYSLEALLKILNARGTKTLDVLTLLSKPSRRKVTVDVKYVGFEIPDVFVVGYGMDVDEKYRELPDVRKVV